MIEIDNSSSSDESTDEETLEPKRVQTNDYQDQLTQLTRQNQELLAEVHKLKKETLLIAFRMTKDDFLEARNPLHMIGSLSNFYSPVSNLDQLISFLRIYITPFTLISFREWNKHITDQPFGRCTGKARKNQKFD